MASPRQGFYESPKTVDQYLYNFKFSIQNDLKMLDPGHRVDYHIIDAFVTKINVRKIMIYIAHGKLESARKVSSIYYTLPTDEHDGSFFMGRTISHSLPSSGPIVKTFNVPERFETTTDFINAIVAETGANADKSIHIVAWGDEIENQEAIGRAPGPIGVRRNANRLARYMTEMREKVLKILCEVNIKVPGVECVVPAAPASASPAGGAGAAPVGSPGRSSTATRRRRSSARRRLMTRRKSNSDPARLTPPNIYNTVLRATRPARHNGNIFTLRNISNAEPGIIKRVRRRRSNSDPKDD